MVEVPVDVSKVGFKGTLKSPPSISIPVWNVDKMSVVCLKKVTCLLFGAYMLARVMGLSLKVPLRKMNLPSLSLWESEILRLMCLEISMVTPFVLDSMLAAW